MDQKKALTTKQRRALEALLTTPTVKAAAKKAGVNRNTVHRYLQDASFRAELRQAQGDILAATMASLVGMSGDVVDTLARLLADDEVSDSVKARAALGWLANVHKVVELDVILERLEQLEAAIAQGMRQ